METRRTTKKYSSGSSVITHIIKSQEGFLHFTSNCSRYNASQWETKIPFGFRSNLFIHGFAIFSVSRFIITESSLLEKPMPLIT